MSSSSSPSFQSALLAGALAGTTVDLSLFPPRHPQDQAPILRRLLPLGRLLRHLPRHRLRRRRIRPRRGLLLLHVRNYKELSRQTNTTK
ncbi:uncharacterized protein TrAtP1_012618 [Trichoderma atroviride]|uniref:uncharacterized protein n=1 Tax=Hypocrea atroviridis TaxID=63577 RepID=UPI0033245BE6|nr:hypothetical protein TrAtP1_012618 [Trichoderma atroviride]